MENTAEKFFASILPMDTSVGTTSSEDSHEHLRNMKPLVVVRMDNGRYAVGRVTFVGKGGVETATAEFLASFSSKERAHRALVNVLPAETEYREMGENFTMEELVKRLTTYNLNQAKGA